MFHLLAYTKSVAAGSQNEDIPGVTDGYATLVNNHYVLSKDLRLRLAFAMGANITAARINSPSLRAIALPHICPLEVSATVTDVPNIADYQNFLPILPRIDEVAVETSNSSGTAERHVVGLWLDDVASRPALPGPVFTVRGAASITTGNLVWGEGSINLESTLPAGRYQVVGLDVVGPNLVFARLRFPEQNMLPGVLARTSQSQNPFPQFRVGRLGMFGEFESIAPPLLQVFGTAAPTTQIVYLDLVKVG